MELGYFMIFIANFVILSSFKYRSPVRAHSVSLALAPFAIRATANRILYACPTRRAGAFCGIERQSCSMFQSAHQMIPSALISKDLIHSQLTRTA